MVGCATYEQRRLLQRRSRITLRSIRATGERAGRPRSSVYSDARAPSPEDFVRLWTGMIEHALTDPAWDPSMNRSSDLDGIVFELLGFDSRMNKLPQNPAFTSAVAGMEGVFAKAAQRWFGMPKVVTGFLNFVTQPAAAGLLLPGIRWLTAVVPSFDSYDWKYGLERI